MKLKWVHLGGVFEGRYCIAQGILEQIGDVGVSLCTMAIATHTFAELILRWSEPRSFRIPIIVITLYAIFISLIIGIGTATHRGKDYYGDTTYWCWIRKNYVVDGIALEYAWLWLAALLNVLFYIPVFLVLRRILIVEPVLSNWSGYQMRFTNHEERRTLRQSVTKMIKPHRMLFYPAVYIVTVVPIGISRIHSLTSGSSTSTPLNVTANSTTVATVICSVLFEASGFFNVLVFTFTRPALRRPLANNEPKSGNIFFYSSQRPAESSINGIIHEDESMRNVEQAPPSPVANVDNSFVPSISS